MSKAPHTPPLNIAGSTLHAGRLTITATYASSRGAAVYTTEGRDDGTVLDCDCPGYRARGYCWHTARLALDWFAALWAHEPTAALVTRERHLTHYIALAPGGADEAAARIELTVVGDAIGERMGRAA